MAISWTEPQIVLAISRAGTLTGAARALGIDHSTVYRRLRALEHKLGARLFERLPGGTYHSTEAGERMALAAERMEDEVLTLDRDLTGGDLKLTGRLRITSSESLAYRLLTPRLDTFRRAHPGIGIDLILDNRVLDLSRREADVALRPTRPTEGNLWGRKLANIAWAIYGSRGLLFRSSKLRTRKRNLANYNFIGWDDSSQGVLAAEWIEKHVGASNVSYRTASLINQLAAAESGFGLAVLPCYLGDLEPGLVRAVPEPIAELQDELWIITHAGLRNTARIRAFLDLVGEGMISERDLISGKRPRASIGHRGL